jgi:hypothetical protein
VNFIPNTSESLKELDKVIYGDEENLAIKTPSMVDYEEKL